MNLGQFGIWTSYRLIGEENAVEAARLVERLGFGTLWLGGSPRLPKVRPLLEATSGLTVATGIVDVWKYEPADLAAEHAALSAEFPGRLLLGLGVGHPEVRSEYVGPLSKMRAFLDGLDAAGAPVTSDQRCLAALGPKMLDLSAERSLGAHPYFTPPEHTRWARQRLGPTPLLAPELACVLESDRERAREVAREYARTYLRLRNYTNNLRRLGFTDDDLQGGGSDRLLDALIPRGTAADIARAAAVQMEAGADHVCLQPVGVKGIPHDEWQALSLALGLQNRRPPPAS